MNVTRGWRAWAGLAGFILVCFGVAWIGSSATTPQIDGWYRRIDKPDWNPPNWIFGPVWSTLYLMMAVSAWLVWKRLGWSEGRAPLAWFSVQLALNCAWSFSFFAMQSPAAGLVNIVALWAAILGSIVSFARVHRLASALLVPYFLWVSFAAVLNFAIWRLN